jgi:hypothetical protein
MVQFTDNEKLYIVAAEKNKGVVAQIYFQERSKMIFEGIHG